MQTFLPYPSFVASAECLDNKRLGKQRVECLQILQTLQKKKENPNAKIAWANHPIVKMWEGYEVRLVSYGKIICLEWVSRGFKDTCFAKIREFDIIHTNDIYYALPPFVGDEQFHLSHQSNLLRKDFNHYSKYFNVPDNLPYKWYNPKAGEFYEIHGAK